MNTQVTGSCDICKEDIAPAKNQAQFNRNRGLHLRAVHGIVSKHNRRRSKLNGLSPLEKKERLREQKNLWYQKHKASRRIEPEAPAPVVATSSAQPCKLSECPECGSRFYICKGPGITS